MEKKLLELGFKPTKGLYYLAKAVEIKKDGKMTHTGNIYRSVADLYNSTPSRVERCMRHCIQTSDTKYRSLPVGYVISMIALEQ